MTNSSIYYVTQPPPSGFLDVEDLQKIGLKSVRNTAKRRVAAQIQGISQKMEENLSSTPFLYLFQSLNANGSRN
ncbi:hypothetical protein Bca4012_020437 [Brassica carinata]|uniref:Uncharacterized protein n=1 Tax=Brassica carinata TaxID=52824 RepID=A0A8X8BD46_BRACI|nr:hypothetical protein Bca52824_001203 [Brassica carinata]